MKGYVANLSIRTKLLFCFALISAIPALIVFSSSYRISIKNSERISLNYSRTAVEQTAKLIENFLEICENTCAYVSSDDEIIAALEDYGHRKPETEKIIDEKLMQLHKSIVPDAYAVYVIGENGFQYKSVSQQFSNYDLKYEMLYWKVSNSKEAYWDGPNSSSWALRSPEMPFLAVGRRIYGTNGALVGVVIIEIQETVISNMLLNEKTAQQAEGMSLEFICLLDKTFRIISHTDSSKIGTQMPGSIAYSQDTESMQRYNSDYLTVTEPIADRWMVLGGTYLPDLRQQSASPFSIIVTGFVFVIVLAVGMSFFLSRYISSPIKRMTKLMQEVEEGNLDVRAKMKYYDEVGIMGRVFNNMLDQLHVYMERIRDNEKRLMVLQYDVLREQIKPHFMYNTLDSVRWLARDGKNKEVERLSLALMKFYRLHLSDGSDTVTLRTEAEHINNYLIIQQIRYKKEIRDYRIYIPDEIANCRMLKLTLQPLVENAIYHGLKNATDGGTISITAHYDQTHISLCVEDTGVGITSERLAELNKMLQLDTAKVGYGLRNVNARLKLMFGSNYGLRIESEAGQGTSVYVLIPRINEER